ncbi:MAG TPA: HAD family hydrolase [Abditibacterium sp.]|jgi:putative hydrolase of the HAD superfamily
MIEAVIFDLDGTLVDREMGARNWLRAHYEKLPSPNGDFSDFYQDFQKLDARGHTSKLETFAELAQIGDWKQTPEEIWADYRRHVWRHCELFPDVITTLNSLRKSGLTLAILTNGTVECQQGKIEALGLDALVDVVVISEREGCKKPAPELFWRACEKLKKKPENCLMIGDNFKADVQGALDAGLEAIFLQHSSSDDSIPNVPTIHAMSEVVSFLDSIT